MVTGETPKKEKTGSQSKEGKLRKKTEFGGQIEDMISVNNQLTRIAKGNFL